MRKDKNVKITFHSLEKKEWNKEIHEGDNIPFYMIENVLDYINDISDKKQRFYELKSGKFCFIDVIRKEIINEKVTLYSCIFKSARNEFRPKLINKNTGFERDNPKELSEGDIELTHFVVKISKLDNETYLFLENNHYGVTPINATNYLYEFTKKYLLDNEEKIDFSLQRMELPTNNFLTELERLKRTALAEVYFDKKLLGSEALDFSNRTISIRHEIMLTAKASKQESITEFGIDLWNKMQRRDSLVSRIRIRGTDEENNSILLDTSKLSRVDFITVDVNQETGEVNSFQLLTGLRHIALDF